MSQAVGEEPDEFDFPAAYEQLAQLLRSGGTFGARRGITDEECEALYQVGCTMYEQERYSDAFKAFSVLVMQNHLEPRYLIALAGACQMLGRYIDALQHYMTATVARLDDPKPVFHSAECLIALERLPEAKETLELALTLCGDKHEAVRDRAQALLRAVQTKMN